MLLVCQPLVASCVAVCCGSRVACVPVCRPRGLWAAILAASSAAVCFVFLPLRGMTEEAVMRGARATNRARSEQVGIPCHTRDNTEREARTHDTSTAIRHAPPSTHAVVARSYQLRLWCGVRFGWPVLVLRRRCRWRCRCAHSRRRAAPRAETSRPTVEPTLPQQQAAADHTQHHSQEHTGSRPSFRECTILPCRSLPPSLACRRRCRSGFLSACPPPSPRPTRPRLVA